MKLLTPRLGKTPQVPARWEKSHHSRYASKGRKQKGERIRRRMGEKEGREEYKMEQPQHEELSVQELYSNKKKEIFTNFLH